MKKIYKYNYIIDFILFFLAIFISLKINKYQFISENLNFIFWMSILFITIGKVLFFYFFRIYNIIIKYIQFHDAIKIIVINLVCSTIFLMVLALTQFSKFLYLFYVMTFDFILSVIFSMSFRYIEKYLFHVPIIEKDKKLIYLQSLIIGAGEAGSMVLREIRNHPESHIKVVGFIDDDNEKLHMSMAGKPILGKRNDILDLVKKKSINLIIIALPSAKRRDINDIIEICEKAEVKLKIVPPTLDIIAGDVKFEQIRDIKIEDLLSRDEIKLDTKGIKDYLKNKTVLITGAGGSIGSEISRQVSAFHINELLLLGKGENSIFEINAELTKKYPELKIRTLIADVRDNKKLEKIFNEYKPNVVFHAAAHKHVHLMELHPDEAFINNVIGTKNLIELSMKYHAERFVLISTDKAVHPESVMGMTKRIAEKIMIGYSAQAQKMGCRLIAVRFGNVLGSRGSVVPIFKEQIESGGPVTVTHPEVKRYFMTIPEAVQLVLQASGYGKGGEIFILKMGKPVRIVDLARKMISLSGYVPDNDIKIEYIGLKPGEKLFEELVINSETVDETKYDKILVAKPEKVNLKDLINDIEKIEKKVYILNKEQLKKMIRVII